MSLREILAKPLALEPLARDNHTHTVIFLHRYPQNTTEKALVSKVLSARYTKDTRSIRLEFPTVRWVYPYPKLTGTDGTHWTSLDDRDIALLELKSDRKLPYITQIILQEAKRVGGLEKVIVGGQGETAVAAHDAMCRLPELTRELRNDAEKVKQFLRDHLGSSGDAIGDLRLGGYVGMHPDNGQLTRDERSYSLMSHLGGGSSSVSSVAVTNTPHLFIRGGYQDATALWGGQRIDDFVDFLESTVGVFRSSSSSDTSEALSSSSPAVPSSSSNTVQGSLGPQLEADFVADPAQRRAAALASQRDLAAQRKHADEASRAKRAEERHRKVLRERIEMDKRDRAAVFAQRRQNRLEAERDTAAAAAAGPSSSEQQDQGDVVDAQGHSQLPYDQEYYEESSDEDSSEDDRYIEGNYSPGRSDSQRWLPPQPRGSMTTQRMRALGAYKDKTEDKAEDNTEGETVKKEGGH